MRSWIIVTLAVLAAALLLSACGDAVDPSTPKVLAADAIYGSVIVCDEHLQPVSDQSGVVVKFRDTSGTVYQGFTNKDGEWEIELPAGTYLLDTIMGTDRILLKYGHRLSLTVHPMDYFEYGGSGREEVLRESVLCPPTLDSVFALKDLEGAIETWTEPANPVLGTPEQELSKITWTGTAVGLKILVGISRELTSTITLADGSTLGTKSNKHNYATDALTGESVSEPAGLRSLQGAVITQTFTAKVTQESFVRLSGSSFLYGQRTIPSRPSQITCVVP